MSDIGQIVTDITGAIKAGNPKGLHGLESLTFAEKDSLRNQLQQNALTERDRDWLLKWAWTQDSATQNAARTLILLHHDIPLLVTCCERFLDGTRPSFPYQVAYNPAEQEFSLDLAGTPGISVSHHGRADKTIDKFLLVLERTYQRIYPQRNIPWFRS